MKREVRECQASRRSRSIFDPAKGMNSMVHTKGGTQKTFLDRLILMKRNIEISLRNFEDQENSCIFSGQLLSWLMI
jgi:hypothetical protein